MTLSIDGILCIMENLSLKSDLENCEVEAEMHDTMIGPQLSKSSPHQRAS